MKNIKSYKQFSINESTQNIDYVYVITGKFERSKEYNLSDFESLLQQSIDSDQEIPMRERWYLYPDKINDNYRSMGFQLILIKKYNVLKTIKEIHRFLNGNVYISVGISNEDKDHRFQHSLRTWMGNSAILSGRNLDKMKEPGVVINTNSNDLTSRISNSLNNLEAIL